MKLFAGKKIVILAELWDDTHEKESQVSHHHHSIQNKTGPPNQKLCHIVMNNGNIRFKLDE
jgi:hypothetical protein